MGTICRGIAGLFCVYTLNWANSFPLAAAWTQPVQLLAVKTTVYAAVDRAVVQDQFTDTADQMAFIGVMSFSYPAIFNQLQ